MSLGSVLHVALTGISAAKLAVNVASDNLANANTDGFKQSMPQYATQTPRTSGSGAAATVYGGGANPTQVGSGVRAAEVSTDFSSTDAGQNLIELTTASLQFRANINVLNAADAMFAELTNLSRS